MVSSSPGMRHGLGAPLPLEGRAAVGGINYQTVTNDVPNSYIHEDYIFPTLGDQICVECNIVASLLTNITVSLVCKCCWYACDGMHEHT